MRRMTAVLSLALFGTLMAVGGPARSYTIEVGDETTVFDLTQHNSISGTVRYGGAGFPGVAVTLYDKTTYSRYYGLKWSGMTVDRWGYWENIADFAVPDHGQVATVDLRITMLTATWEYLDVDLQAPDGTRVAIHRATERAPALLDGHPPALGPGDEPCAWHLWSSAGDGNPSTESLRRFLGIDPCGTWRLLARTPYDLSDISWRAYPRFQGADLKLYISPIADTVTTDADGRYSTAQVSDGRTYQVVPRKRGYTFSPADVMLQYPDNLGQSWGRPTYSRIVTHLDFSVSGEPRLVFTRQPGTTATGTAFSPALQVTLEAQDGSTISDMPATVTLSPAGAGASGSLSGATAVALVNGVANFPGVAPNGAAGGWQVVAGGPGLATGLSNTFTVTPEPVHLVFGTQPSETQPWRDISPPVTVEVRGTVTGALITNVIASVHLDLNVSRTGYTWYGNGWDASTVNGVATFDRIHYSRLVTGATLWATNNSWSQGMFSSSPFNVVPVHPMVTSPNGGEAIGVGADSLIKWDCSQGANEAVRVELSRDGGQAWATLFASIPDVGQVHWTVTGPVTDQARVRVTSLKTNYGDTSDANFTIEVPAIAGQYPVVGFLSQPTNTEPGQVILPPVQVILHSSNPMGSPWSWFMDLEVTVKLLDSAGSDVTHLLSGTLTQLLPAGQDTVTFGDLRVSQEGSGYVLRAYTLWGGYPKQGYSQPFNVTVPPVGGYPDTEPPTIGAPDDVTAELTQRAGTPAGSIDLGAPVVSDDRDPNPVVANDAPGLFPYGETTVTWRATDAAGNTSTAIQKVTIVDTTPPVLVVPPDAAVEFDSPTDPAHTGQATATDVHDASPAIAYQDARLGGTDRIDRTWTATDNLGNSVSGYQAIYLRDATPPALTVPSDVTSECTSPDGTQVAIGQATATDNHDPAPTVTSDAPALYPYGVTTVTWTATDLAGNTATATQKVTVVDTTPPALTVPPNVTVECTSPDGMQVAIGQATATDNHDRAPVVTSDAPVLFPPGITTVTWTAADSAGLKATGTQKVGLFYSWSGFQQPISMSGPRSTFKLGRTVPVKFQLTGGSSGIVLANARFGYARLSGDAGDVNQPGYDAPPDAGGAFRYDSTTKQYTYNWGTRGLAVGTYRIGVDLGDGVSRTVDIELR